MLLALIVGLWFFSILNFTVNDAGELPNVTVEGGAPDVDVNIQVPDVDVTTEERTVTVPQIEVSPSEDPREEAVVPPEDN